MFFDNKFWQMYIFFDFNCFGNEEKTKKTPQAHKTKPNNVLENEKFHFFCCFFSVYHSFRCWCYVLFETTSKFNSCYFSCRRSRAPVMIICPFLFSSYRLSVIHDSSLRSFIAFNALIFLFVFFCVVLTHKREYYFILCTRKRTIRQVEQEKSKAFNGANA